MSSEKAHLDAIKTKINAAGGVAMTPEEVKQADPKPGSYTEVQVALKLTEGARYGGRVDIDSVRVLTRAVADIFDNALEMRRRTQIALEDVTVTVGGVESTPIERAVPDDPIAEDESWYSGLSEWSYAL